MLRTRGHGFELEGKIDASGEGVRVDGDDLVAEARKIADYCRSGQRVRVVFDVLDED